jgi:hypothetical protein
MDHPGRCHCGALGFVLSSDTPPAGWQVRACQCAFCRAHSALSVSDPSGTLRLTHRDASRLQRYQFALRTADFLLCRDCGVYIAAVTRDGKHGIINTRALVDPPALGAAQPMVYDGESEATRLARRAERWTPVV